MDSNGVLHLRSWRLRRCFCSQSQIAICFLWVSLLAAHSPCVRRLPVGCSAARDYQTDPHHTRKTPGTEPRRNLTGPILAPLMVSLWSTLSLSRARAHTHTRRCNHTPPPTGERHRRHPVRHTFRATRRDRPRALVPRRRDSRAAAPETRTPPTASPPRSYSLRLLTEKKLGGAATPGAKKTTKMDAPSPGVIVEFSRIEGRDLPGGPGCDRAARRKLDGRVAAVKRSRGGGCRGFLGCEVGPGGL